jgi:hypothetical protein
LSWWLKTVILWLLAIPAFSGFPLNHVQGDIVPGAAYGWVGYGLMIHITAWALLGKEAYRVAIFICMLITLPVVFLGAGISFAGLFIRGWDPVLQAFYSAHYISLAITMLTVIPLALSMVAVIPFHRIEYRLLQKSHGASIMEKSALMFLRVFSHIFYFVIPNILEVIREERVFPILSGRRKIPGVAPLAIHRRLAIMVRILIQIGVEGICAAVRYVPLWADEISRLPGRNRIKKKSKNDLPPNETQDKI